MAVSIYEPGTHTMSLISGLYTITGRAFAVVHALGNTSANDGQGGLFYWDSASTVADDGLNTVRPTIIAAPDPGRWRRFTPSPGSSTMFDATGMIAGSPHVITDSRIIGASIMQVFVEGFHQSKGPGTNCLIDTTAGTITLINFSNGARWEIYRLL